ncbi:MAG: quinone-dependent dihydroorotate dehydrogenase [Synechococcales cyanobacterium CRU_2_2]|nr:quinone-dependent dihydroorotate dehydrogenase [Synechococcales cyanobacterium CRU_2_2]
MDIYTAIARPLIFSGLKLDPEQAHQQALQWLQWLDQPGPTGDWMRGRLRAGCAIADPRLSQTLWNQTFPNPIGLAAGFDKDGVAARLWPEFGFGFAEVGTVTWHPQPGNLQPRLFRLVEDQAVLNRMGFNNQGAERLAERLSRRLARDLAAPQTPRSHFPLGINLGKSKITPLEVAAPDYAASFELLKNLGDYFVVNVSSPNTPGLRSLQATEQLKPILDALQAANDTQKPILVKISPDLAESELAAVVDWALEDGLAGIIATNTTINRTNLRTQVLAATGKAVLDEPGGISGRPLGDRSTEVIRFIYKRSQGQLPIIGVGGVFTAEDAWNKITAGASLIQIYTGWIYEGPWMVKRILQGLLQKLQEHGLEAIAQATGLHAQK